MNAFRHGDDKMGVIQDGDGFKIALYSVADADLYDDLTLLTPYHVYDVEFPSRELAEKVCVIMIEEYNDGKLENY